MIGRFFRILDNLAYLLGFIAKILILVLISTMIYEVISRYLFNHSNLWAFDMAYMLNGSIFLFSIAYTLHTEAHIRIDFLSERFPMKIQQLINGLGYLFILGPIISLLAKVAADKAWQAFVYQSVDNVSPWAPLTWPFNSVIALGLVVLALQFYLEGVRYLTGLRQPGEPFSTAYQKQEK